MLKNRAIASKLLVGWLEEKARKGAGGGAGILWPIGKGK